MERTVFYSFFFLALLFSFSRMNAQISAIQYYNQIVEEHGKVYKKNKRFITTVIHTEKSDEVERYRKEILRQIDTSIAVISAMKPFKSDDQLRTETIAILKREKEVYLMDFNQIVQLKKNAADTYEAMEKFFRAGDQAEEKVNAMINELRLVQKRFAEKNHLTIQEDEKLKVQIQKISQLNKYTEIIFLNYFKAFRDFNFLADAINTKKAEMIEKARLQLILSANQGLANMRAQGSFENDSAYVKAGILLMEKYEFLARVDMLEVARLLKTPDKLTKEDVSRINSILMYMNTELEELSIQFQHQERKLFQLHVPKD